MYESTQSTEKPIKPLPFRPTPPFLELLLEQDGQVEVSPPRVEIHLLDADNLSAEPELVPYIHDDDDRSSGIIQKEILDILSNRVVAVINGPRADPELSDEDEDIQQEPDPGAQDASLSPEGKFVKGATAEGPCFAEADVREADGGPGEEGGEGGDREEPVEDGFFLLDVGKVGEEAEHAGAKDGHQGTTAAVDVGEPARGLALVSKGGDGAARAEDG